MGCLSDHWAKANAQRSTAAHALYEHQMNSAVNAMKHLSMFNIDCVCRFYLHRQENMQKIIAEEYAIQQI